MDWYGLIDILKVMDWHGLISIDIVASQIPSRVPETLAYTAAQADLKFLRDPKKQVAYTALDQIQSDYIESSCQAASQLPRSVRTNRYTKWAVLLPHWEAAPSNTFSWIAQMHPCITLHYLTLHRIILHKNHTIPRRTRPYHTLYYITLHRITSHYITLHIRIRIYCPRTDWGKPPSTVSSEAIACSTNSEASPHTGNYSSKVSGKKER